MAILRSQAIGAKGTTSVKMQCFICVTYMFFICSAYPRREGPPAERSLFHDVIESLKYHAQLPEDTNRNEENTVGQIYERYGYENDELRLPIDAEFVPRRNDRIAQPPLKYRLPKMIANETDVKAKDSGALKEEVVIYISTTETPKLSTQRMKRKTTRQPSKKKPSFALEIESANKTLRVPVVNTMADQSHIGNKKIHMVVTPNIVVNFRTNENNKETSLKLTDDKNSSNIPSDIIPQNIFNIHQEINLEKDIMDFDDKKEDMKELKRVKQDIKVISRDEKPRVEEDMMMCETGTWAPENNNINNRNGRKIKNVLEILFSL